MLKEDRTMLQINCPTEQHRRDSDVVSPAVKCSVFAGIFLLRVLDGIPWVWGNLAVYVTSYYYAKGDNSSADLTNWLISVDCFAFNLGLLIGGVIARQIGVRLTIFIAILFYNGGIALTYFTLQHSAIALCVTFGAMTGISGGIIENCQLSLIVQWTKRYQGLSASSVPSSSILGSVVVNLVLTMFINPSNDETDAVKYDTAIFTQSDIVSRVPYSFLLYGCISFSLNIIGFLLIRPRHEGKNILTELFCRATDVTKSHDENIQLLDRSPESEYSLVQLRNGDVTPSCHDNENENLQLNEDDTNSKNTPNHDLTPKQALKTRTFYALWAFSAILNYAFFILNTYYKEFGLLHIPDDHFLTMVVMVKCLCTPICTWIAGFAVDKYGVKPTTIVGSCIFCTLASFFDFTVFNKWLYLFSTVLYGCSLFSLFCLTSACCVKLFGESHFSTIFGLVLTSTNLMVLTVPPLADWIITACGWNVLFGSVAVLALLQVFVIVLGLPEKKVS